MRKLEFILEIISIIIFIIFEFYKLQKKYNKDKLARAGLARNNIKF